MKHVQVACAQPCSLTEGHSSLKHIPVRGPLPPTPPPSGPTCSPDSCRISSHTCLFTPPGWRSSSKYLPGEAGGSARPDLMHRLHGKPTLAAAASRPAHAVATCQQTGAAAAKRVTHLRPSPATGRLHQTLPTALQGPVGSLITSIPADPQTHPHPHTHTHNNPPHIAHLHAPLHTRPSRATLPKPHPAFIHLNTTATASFTWAWPSSVRSIRHMKNERPLRSAGGVCVCVCACMCGWGWGG